MKRLLLIALYTVGLATAAQSQGPTPPFKPDAEGFIRNWLVLAPVAIEGESGASEIDRDILKGEAAIAPKAGDKIGVGSQLLGWTAHQTSDYFIDFLQSFGGTRGEYVAGYAVAYINVDEEMKVTLALSTNDQGKAWLNGKQVFKFAETRTLEKDTDRTDVTLVKGQNILVLKVINEVNNWQACARFLKNGEPVKNLQITTAPK
jgi:opacity protein-like surface antigen